MLRSPLIALVLLALPGLAAADGAGISPGLDHVDPGIVGERDLVDAGLWQRGQSHHAAMPLLRSRLALRRHFEGGLRGRLQTNDQRARRQRCQRLAGCDRRLVGCRECRALARQRPCNFSQPSSAALASPSKASSAMAARLKRSIEIPYCGRAGAAKPCFASVRWPSAERMNIANLYAGTEAPFITVRP